MAQSSDINLYKAKTELSAETVLLAKRLRLGSYAAMIIALGVGIAVGVVYFILTLQKQQLEAEKDTISKRIIAQAKKETLAIEVKDRSSTASKVVKSQRPWLSIIQAVTAFAPPPLLTGFNGDETKTMHVNVKAPSLDEAITVVQGAMSQTIQKNLQKTILESVGVDKDGFVTLSFTFQTGTAL